MLFTSTAYAMAGNPQGAGGGADVLTSLVPFILMFAVFYFLLVRPQQKRAKQHKEMLNALRKGDEVITNGGVFGRIVDTDETTLLVDIGSGTIIKILRSSVTSRPNPASQLTTKAGKKADRKADKKATTEAVETSDAIDVTPTAGETTEDKGNN